MDVVGAAAVFVGGAPNTGVSVEINVSYVDVAYTGVRASFSLSCYIQPPFLQLFLTILLSIAKYVAHFS